MIRGMYTSADRLEMFHHPNEDKYLPAEYKWQTVSWRYSREERKIIPTKRLVKFESYWVRKAAPMMLFAYMLVLIIGFIKTKSLYFAGNSWVMVSVFIPMVYEVFLGISLSMYVHYRHWRDKKDGQDDSDAVKFRQGATDNDTIAVLSKHQVPFYGYTPHINETELLEEDKYGRKLYRCTSRNSSEHHTQLAVFSDFSEPEKNIASGVLMYYLIVQSERLGRIEYYDNMCYMCVPSFSSTTKDEIEDFKMRNDWGKEPDTEKISVLEYDKSVFNLLVEPIDSRIYELVEKEFGIKKMNLFICKMGLYIKPDIYIIRDIVGWNDLAPIIGRTNIFAVDENCSIISSCELDGNFSEWAKQIAEFNTRLHQIM